MQLDPADIVYSKFIRTRDDWTCQRCRRQFPEGSQELDNSHYWGRGKENVRFDDINCTALCRKCHQYFDAKNKKAYKEFKIKQIGLEEFKKLAQRANTLGHKDRVKALALAKEKLKNIIKVKNYGCAN